ncbi:MAG: hypothetical protein LHV69_09125 [Elusimicrobia bacterium]|nr:hypothetical protein [Candidatus Obscuribacterium magneticum]
MKKLILIFLVTLPWSCWASLNTKIYSSGPKDMPLPFPLLSAPKTATYEWGCPVSEVVSANSGAEAIDKIKKECMEEAKKAARLKPGVSDIIKISVIVPDVLVSKHERGFYLKGTFFLETVVFQQTFAGR